MDNDLHFDRAEFTAPQHAMCDGCKTTLDTEYYAANGRVFCAQCATGLRQFAEGPGSRVGRFAKSVLLGGGAALLGGGLYFAIMKFANSEWALISIGVGYFVGRAVRIGSAHRGGWRYQLLAALLTYLAIAGAYAPFVIQGFREHTPKSKTTEVIKDSAVKVAPASAEAAASPDATASASADAPAATPHAKTRPTVGTLILALVVVGGLFIAAPILSGFSNPIGLLIIGFGIWQAWKVNRRLQLEITGPHALSSPEPALSA